MRSKRLLERTIYPTTGSKTDLNQYLALIFAHGPFFAGISGKTRNEWPGRALCPQERRQRMRRPAVLVAGVFVGGLTALGGVLLARSGTKRGAHDDAPGRTARTSRFGNYDVTGATVTITKPPRDELFRRWRDFEKLPDFMENLETVERRGDGWRWTIKAPGGKTVSVDTEIAEERDGALIAWRSVESSDIDTEGRVAFHDAPGGGTQVSLTVAYKPPLGKTGKAVAKIFQREPAIQARRDLRRFRMLMETGEIATSHNRRDAKETT
ncbi:SRPBCC family protein [Stakelama saccharophila]|uniref:SRPBCC family protein n=1 Tax=Stakelama saccharophila TaxID=3075605 RepID=A0ABZ0B5L1_9SPHN|nr:SRPBCC family protein [Stakelama sp. W311]WNO52563.1 SRPBCC family protein [Stakelama sp. W311]